jgi:hypothetical protein
MPTVGHSDGPQADSTRSSAIERCQRILFDARIDYLNAQAQCGVAELSGAGESPPPLKLATCLTANWAVTVAASGPGNPEGHMRVASASDADVE